MSEREPPAKRGPDPESLAIEGPWQEAVEKALQKKRPPEGWPGKKARAKRPKKGGPKRG